MNENQTAILGGGILLIVGIIVFSEANNLAVILQIGTTEIIGVILGIIGVVIAILGVLKELDYI